MKKNSSLKLTTAEAILILSGGFILLSTYTVATTGNFTLFWLAKALYGIGVLLLLFKR